MKSIYGKKDFIIDVRTINDNEVGNSDVRVEIKACGLCGTDIHFLRNKNEYTPLGHEMSGVVVEVGRDVRNVSAGDMVVVEDVSFCGVCNDCKNGNVWVCKRGATLNGQAGMSDNIVVNRMMLNRFDGLNYLEACLTEPLAVALSAYLAAKSPANGTVVVFGMGTIGILCTAVFKRFGAKKVILVGRDNASEQNIKRAEIAQNCGADSVLFTDSQRINDQIIDVCKGKADTVIVTSPPLSIENALKVLKYGGTLVPLGIDLSGAGVVPLDINELIFSKHRIQPVLAEPAQYFPLSIDLLKQHVVNPMNIITHTFTFNNVKDIVPKIQNKQEPLLKLVFVP